MSVQACGDAFNQTSMELKRRTRRYFYLRRLPFNQTSMELKRPRVSLVVSSLNSFNQTSMELKLTTPNSAQPKAASI